MSYHQNCLFLLSLSSVTVTFKKHIYKHCGLTHLMFLLCICYVLYSFSSIMMSAQQCYVGHQAVIFFCSTLGVKVLLFRY